MGDHIVAWCIILTVCTAYGLAPDGIRERWWQALTRRGDR